jgi:hypothetical protein
LATISPQDIASSTVSQFESTSGGRGISETIVVTQSLHIEIAHAGHEQAISSAVYCDRNGGSAEAIRFFPATCTRLAGDRRLRAAPDRPALVPA